MISKNKKKFAVKEKQNQEKMREKLMKKGVTLLAPDTIFLSKDTQFGKNVVVDFVCPTPKTREDFNADIVIWVDTIKKGRFEDTNEMFVKPNKFDFRVTEKNGEAWAIKIADKIKKYT